MSRVVCLNCMDGRVQIPVIEWIKRDSGAEHVDVITEAGMDGYLADPGNTADPVYDKVRISIEANQSTAIFVVGHYDCKGNAVDDETHETHIRLAVERLKKDFSGLPVTGLWVNSGWGVEKISE